MMNLKDFEDFMDRADAAGRWDDIDAAEWENACDFAGIDYHSYDDPDQLWDALKFVLNAAHGEPCGMRIYFHETEDCNELIFTDGVKFAEIDGAPDGAVDGIDLYSDSAAEDFRAHFKDEEENGDLNDFFDIFTGQYEKLPNFKGFYFTDGGYTLIYENYK